jgi:hypothetical protein
MWVEHHTLFHLVPSGTEYDPWSTEHFIPDGISFPVNSFLPTLGPDGTAIVMISS